MQADLLHFKTMEYAGTRCSKLRLKSPSKKGEVLEDRLLTVALVYQVACGGSGCA